MEPSLKSISERIAQEVLGITLDERGLDSLDFHNLGVTTLRELIETAYRAGFDAAKEQAQSKPKKKKVYHNQNPIYTCSCESCKQARST